MSDAGGIGRWALALCGGLLAALLAGVYITQSVAVESTRRLSTLALFAGPPENPPFPTGGAPRLRQAIAAKIQALYGHAYDPDTEITVTAGATITTGSPTGTANSHNSPVASGKLHAIATV